VSAAVVCGRARALAQGAGIFMQSCMFTDTNGARCVLALWGSKHTALHHNAQHETRAHHPCRFPSALLAMFTHARVPALLAPCMQEGSGRVLRDETRIAIASSRRSAICNLCVEI